MPAQITCANPACARKFGIPDGATGEKIQCPFCKQTFLVPTAKTVEALRLPAQLVPTGEQRITVQSTQPAVAAGHIRDRRFMMGAVVGAVVGSSLTVVVLGLCVGGVLLLRSIGDQTNQAKFDRAKMDVKSLETAVTTYWTRHAQYPGTLTELCQSDPFDGTPALLTEAALMDPWKQPYRSEPGNLNPQTRKPLIYSNGPPDNPVRISNWVQ